MLRNLPPVTKNLLILNILFYLAALVMMSNGMQQYATDLGAHYFNSSQFKPFQIVTHMFMHDLNSPLHIFFNMFLLVMFGAHLERVWGSKRFFIFYVACGLGALVLYNSIGVWELMELKNALRDYGNDMSTINNYVSENILYPFYDRGIFENNARILLSEGHISAETYNYHLDSLYRYTELQHSSIVGASGALFGLLAGFAMLFPNTELMLMFIPVPIKAKYLIGGYLVYELYNSIYQPGDQVAHLAHVGGAIVGIIFILIWRRNDRKNFW